MKRSKGHLREQKDTLFSTGDTDTTPDKRPRLDCLSQQGKGSPHGRRAYHGQDLKSPSPATCSLSSLKRSEGHLKEQHEALLSTGDTEKTPEKRPRLDCISQQRKGGPHCRRVHGKDLKSSSPDACSLSSLKRSEGHLMEQNDTLFPTVDTEVISAKRRRVGDLIHQVKEQVSTETVSEDSAKVQQRPNSTVEEDFQKEERKKVRHLLEPRKGVSQRSSMPTATSTHPSSPRSQMDTLKSKSLGDESSHEFKTTQLDPRPSKFVETTGPVHKVKIEETCSKGKVSAREKSTGVTLENISTTGHQLEPDFSETLSPPFNLGDGSKGVLRREVSRLQSKDKLGSGKSMEKRMDDDLELTADMEKEIRNALGPGPRDQILSSAFKQRITRGDLQTLRNDQWLNDEVINFYMNLLMERNRKQDYPALYAFSTFFYPKLMSAGYQAVKRWTKGVNLFDQELILVPIHQEVHWSLVVIDVRKKSLKYLDSMGHKGHKICEMLLQYLQEESQTKRNIDLNLLEWTLYSMKPHEIPQQFNGSDCGVFTCQFANYISRDKPITFTQHQMPVFRKKMVLEILHQQLL
ncbi:sentrin-specific protease 2-like [Suncus etruscus]|uniref:sentrin-specific protease 2-like n=1 Tax=Suncus etruscus TaxID=109475 RepID=UPI0021100175|nr:sentrin-specific protease 2-like [Suncus etruscus]